MQTDYNSIESVTMLIKNSGLKKFKIQRVGAQKNSAPIFESLSTTSTDSAIEKFNQWATLIENSNPYEMLLFDDENSTLNDDQNVKSKKGKLIRFTFSLNGYSNRGQSANINGSNPINQQDLVKQVVDALKGDAILNKLELMEKRIQEMEEEEEEEEEEEPSQNINGSWTPDKVTSVINGIHLLIDKIKEPVKQPSTAINGAEETKSQNTNGTKLSAEEMERVQQAINILKNHDPEIGTHLLKLAAIAKNNPSKYKMALSFL